MEGHVIISQTIIRCCEPNCSLPLCSPPSFGEWWQDGSIAFHGKNLEWLCTSGRVLPRPSQNTKLFNEFHSLQQCLELSNPSIYSFSRGEKGYIWIYVSLQRRNESREVCVGLLALLGSACALQANVQLFVGVISPEDVCLVSSETVILFVAIRVMMHAFSPCALSFCIRPDP